ncbi:MAG: hypothetical protein JRI72_00170 [Deltaproteobacteria bacterium]|nr:hypothetical protein [Deltaproteobacteria bacterium]
MKSKEKNEDIFVPPEDVVRMYNELMASPEGRKYAATSNADADKDIDINDLISANEGEKLTKEKMKQIDAFKKRALSNEEFQRALAICKPQTKPAKKVKIMGFAPGWIEAFKDKDGKWIDNSDCEIWCLNEFYKFLAQLPPQYAKATRWFEIHSRYSPTKNIPEHITWLQRAKIPVYMWEHYDDMPTSIPFPKDELCKHFGWTDGKGETVPFKYFSCQPAWMLAMAIYAGFEQIEMYGVNMATDGEFNKQRPSCEYWLGVIYGIYYANKYKNRKMECPVLPEHCDLLTPPGGKLYGFDTDNKARLLCKSRINSVDSKFKKSNSQYSQAVQIMNKSQLAMAEMRGAKSAYVDMLNHIL